MMDAEPTYHLLGYFCEEFSEAYVRRFADLIDQLARARSWTLGPPTFVDRTDECGATLPEDEWVRTVGGCLEIYKTAKPPDFEIEKAMYYEVEAFVAAVTAFSKETGCAFEFELGGEIIGGIEAGRQDEGLSVVLLGEWRRVLGLGEDGDPAE